MDMERGVHMWVQKQELQSTSEGSLGALRLDGLWEFDSCIGRELSEIR